MRYISLGAGVQSTALLVCSCLGLHGVPKADVAIFADTGDEPRHIYEYLSMLESWSSIPIKRVQNKPLGATILFDAAEGRRFASIPLYTSDGAGNRDGMLRRQCTREFKLMPIYREVRRMMGVEKGQRIGSRKSVAMIGITTDEAHRMKPSREAWVQNTWPLVDALLNREDCKRIVTEAGLPMPKKSACVFCPYHDDRQWHELKTMYPDDFERAVAVDRAVRGMTMKGAEAPAYVHRSCRPLSEVEFDPHGAAGQGDLFGNECEGMCGL